MSWKNIKDHYRIGHIVQIREGRIAIGSPYISDLIRVTFDGKVSWGNLGPSHNDDLARYFEEMTADPDKLKQLIDAPDTFERSLVVYTYDRGEIVEKHCEEHGWPNVTHDGFVQYDNSFSPDKNQVIAWAKRNAEAGIKCFERRIRELKDNITEAGTELAGYEADLAKLNLDHPEPPTAD